MYGDLAGGAWVACEDYRLPEDPCHGVVLPLALEEYERLSRSWSE